MQLTLKKDKPWLWYTVFAVCLTVILLYIKFPSESLTRYIRIEAEKRYPDIKIGFDKISLTLSPGIKIRGLKISLSQDPETPVYVSEKSKIRVSILGLLKGDPKYYFTSMVKGGEISGIIEEKDGVKKVDASIDIKEIRLDENVFVHPIINERVEGILTGKITFMGNLSDPIKGTTELSLNMADGKVKFLEPFLGIDRVDFKGINLSGIIDNKKLTIKELNMTGGPLNGNITGTILINSSDFPASRLNLKAEIEPTPSLSQDMPEVERLIKNMMKGGKLRLDIPGTIESPSPKIR